MYNYWARNESQYILVFCLLISFSDINVYLFHFSTGNSVVEKYCTELGGIRISQVLYLVRT